MMTERAKALKPHAKARRADARDAEVGRRVRTFRLEATLSQTELADRIGVTFQQVQKYEKGVNRIGAGRLERIAKALDKPINAFFVTPKVRDETGGAVADESLFGKVQRRDAVQLLGYFEQISSRTARANLVSMAKEFAGAAA